MSFNTAAAMTNSNGEVPPTSILDDNGDVEMNGVLPNGHLMTPHDQRRRAALLADSPELSMRPPLNAGGGSGSVLGVLQEAHTQMSNTGSSSSTTSSIHHNYGFDHHRSGVEISIEDAIEVASESSTNAAAVAAAIALAVAIAVAITAAIAATIAAAVVEMPRLMEISWGSGVI